MILLHSESERSGAALNAPTSELSVCSSTVRASHTATKSDKRRGVSGIQTYCVLKVRKRVIQEKMYKGFHEINLP